MFFSENHRGHASAISGQNVEFGVLNLEVDNWLCGLVLIFNKMGDFKL